MEEYANVALAPKPRPGRLMAGRRADSATLETLFEQESRSLVGMLWVFTGDKAAAEDIAQEAFVRISLAWHRVQDPAKAGAYLRSIAFNLARSQHKRAGKARGREETTGAESDSAEVKALLNDDERQVLLALRALPARQRECLVLRFYSSLEPLQIASATGLSINSVKTHLRRGLEALRGQIGSER